MYYNVMFKKHAAQRMQERLQVKVTENVYFSLEKHFAYVHTYMHNKYEIPVDVYVHRDLSKRFIFHVSRLDQQIMTVYVDKHDMRTQKWFDAMYSIYTRTLKKA